MARLRERYEKEVIPGLKKHFGYENVMQVPRLEKITLNIGVGEAISNAKAMEAAEEDLTAIAGQHPVITRAQSLYRRFPAAYGMPIGLMVTLRGERMYEFLDKLVNAVLPRDASSSGVSRNHSTGAATIPWALKSRLFSLKSNMIKLTSCAAWK